MKKFSEVAVRKARAFRSRYPEMSVNDLVAQFGLSVWMLNQYEDKFPCSKLRREPKGKSFSRIVKIILDEGRLDDAISAIEDLKRTKATIRKAFGIGARVEKAFETLNDAARLRPSRVIEGQTIRVDRKKAAILWNTEIYISSCGHPAFLDKGVERMFSSKLLPKDHHISFFKKVGFDYQRGSIEILPNAEVDYPGIHYNKREKVFEAYVCANGKKNHLGRFKDYEPAVEAVKAFDNR